MEIIDIIIRTIATDDNSFLLNNCTKTLCSVDGQTAFKSFIVDGLLLDFHTFAKKYFLSTDSKYTHMVYVRTEVKNRLPLLQVPGKTNSNHGTPKTNISKISSGKEHLTFFKDSYITESSLDSCSSVNNGHYGYPINKCSNKRPASSHPLDELNKIYYSPSGKKNDIRLVVSSRKKLLNKRSEDLIGVNLRATIIDPTQFTKSKTSLGSGGEGEVFLGTYLHENVAVKVMHGNLKNKFILRRIVAQDTVDKACFIKLLAVSLEKDKIHLILSLFTSINLRAYIRGYTKEDSNIRIKYPYSPENVKSIIIQMYKAISSLHEEYKIVNEDIKPENTLINTNFEVKITDFGISKFQNTDECFKSTVTDSIHGTLVYMPPEVLHGKLWTEQGDAWSLAATAVELVQQENIWPHLVRNGGTSIKGQLLQYFKYENKPNIRRLQKPLKSILEKALRTNNRPKVSETLQMLQMLSTESCKFGFFIIFHFGYFKEY